MDKNKKVKGSERDDCQTPIPGIDYCLIPIIDSLRKAGEKTRYSCQGHIQRESGYIYMDFSMSAFLKFSDIAMELDQEFRTERPIDKILSNDRVLYYPGIIIERAVRTVDDSFSKDELIIRFNFPMYSKFTREEFYEALNICVSRKFNNNLEEKEEKATSLNMLYSIKLKKESL